MSGTKRAEPAASVSFSRRNASVEFPSVKIARTIMNALNWRGSCGEVRLKPDATFDAEPDATFDAEPDARVDAEPGSASGRAVVASAFRRTSFSGTKKISVTAIAPGMIV